MRIVTASFLSLVWATVALAGGAERLAVGKDFHAPDPQLAEWIGVLLDQNPQILAARAGSRADVERVPQERSLPDPMVSYRYFARTPETRVGPQEQALEVSQALPWLGKREAQAERAGHVAAGSAWSTEELERRLVAELKRVYYDTAYLREALAVNAEETALLRRFEQIALTRYSTGEGIQQSAIKVQTDLSRLADQEISIRELLDAALRRIARLLGHPATELSLAPIPMDLADVDYRSDELLREALETHPAVRSAEERVRADETLVRRRQLESRPDLRLGLAYTDVGKRDDPAAKLIPPPDDGKDSWAVTVGWNVPLHRKRIRAGVAEAREQVRSSEQRLADVRTRLDYEIEEGLLRLASLDDRARFYRDVIVPQAEESLGSAEAAYSTNRIDFLDLLDAERVLFQVRLASHRLLADYWIALADLELGLGRAFPGEGRSQ